MKVISYIEQISGLEVFSQMRDGNDDLTIVIAPHSSQARLGSKWDIYLSTDILSGFVQRAGHTIYDFIKEMQTVFSVEEIDIGEARGPKPEDQNLASWQKLAVHKFVIRTELKWLEEESVEALVRGIFERWDFLLP